MDPSRTSTTEHAQSLEALSSTEETAVVEHVLGGWVEGPVVALTRVAGLPGDLDEAVIEGEVVSDAVLPGGKPLSVVGKPVHDELTDSAQGQALVRRLENGHRDEGNVRIGRLDKAPLLLLLLGT